MFRLPIVSVAAPDSLVDEDFPLEAVGSAIYRRTESSPLATLANPELAAYVAESLNRDRALNGSLPVSVDRRGLSGATIVFGFGNVSL